MKRLIVLTAMIAVLAGSVFGQAVPTTGGAGFESPQSRATVGLFTSDADDFINPSSFKDVSFDNWFAMTSFANPNRASIGYATKVGGLYLGLFYHGSFWANIPNISYTEETHGWLDSTDKAGVKVYGTLPDLTLGASPLNQVAVLIGLENMGFRFTFTSTYKYFQDSEFYYGVEYKSYEAGYGIISPQLAWGMTQPLSEKGIKPWATIDLVFNNNFAKEQGYDQVGPYYVAGDEIVTTSDNETRFLLNLGLGGITIAEKNGWSTSFDLEFLLTLYFYENEYDYGIPYTKIKSYSGRRLSATTFQERTEGDFLITPSLSTGWSGETLKLSASLGLGIGIDTSDETPFTLNLLNGSFRKQGSTATEVTFSLNPVLSLAAQWQIHPKLFLNAGGEIDINALNVTTTEGKNYTNGAEDADSDYKTTTSSFGGTTNRLTLGVTFNPITNLSLEAACGVAGNNSISVFTAGAGGLFYFSTILVKVTF